MAQYDKASILLTHLTNKSVAAAARECGLDRSTPYKWLVASRLGKDELQRVEFAGVIAPFHQHWENSLSLMARQLEHDMIRNLTSAASNNGFVEVPVFKDGQQTYKQISQRDYEFERDLEMRSDGDYTLYDKNGQRVPEMQLVKFADAQTMLRTLEAFSKRWRATQQIDVAYSGIVRLGAETKTVEAQPFVDDAEESAKPKLALPLPGSDATPQPTVIVDKDGTRHEVPPPRDPLLEEHAKQAKASADNGPRNPLRDPLVPLQGEVSYMDLFKPRRGGSFPHLEFDAEGYPCKPAQRSSPHADPSRGPSGHAAGIEATRGFKVV
jgi:hypothetical protein